MTPDELTALKMLKPLVAEQGRQRCARTDPASCALQAAAFTCVKPLLKAAEWTLDWAESVNNPRRTTPVGLVKYAEISAKFARTGTGFSGRGRSWGNLGPA